MKGDLVKVFSGLMVIPFALLMSTAQADVRLQLGNGVNLHAIDGEAWEGPGMFESKSPIILENGTHQIVVDVTAELGRNRDDSVIESSDSFVLLFQADNRELMLSVPEIESRSQLEDFNDEPSWNLRDAEGKRIDFKRDVLKKTGFQLVRDYEAELAEFNREGISEAALMSRRDARGSFAPSSPSMSASEVAEGQEGQEVVRQMLRYWYLKADENTKSEMKHWINSGE